MKISKQQQTSQSRLNKKGAIIDIDSIVAYVIFIAIIVFLVNYSIGLTTPFVTGIESLNKEKNTITVSQLVNNNFAVNQLSELCDITYPGLSRLSITYEIKSFKMPFNDLTATNVSEISEGLIFKREGETLRVITYSDSETRNINAQVILNQGASVNNISLDSGDSFLTYYDELTNFIISINSIVSNGDIDELIITPINDIVYFQINGIELSNTYIGNLTASNLCGFEGIIGPRTSFERYGIMTDGINDYYVKLTGDAGWTS